MNKTYAYRVGQRFRLNPLSYEHSECEIMVIYFSEPARTYTNVHDPSAYVNKIIRERLEYTDAFPESDNQARVSVRESDIETIVVIYENAKFEVWDYKKPYSINWILIDDFNVTYH